MQVSTEQRWRCGPTMLALGLVVVVLAVSFWIGGSVGRRSSSDPSVETARTQPDRKAKLASMGRLVYQLQCVRCHGLEGHGDGPDAADLKPRPRDFASTAWRFEPTIESIERVTAEGILDTAMTGFGRALSRTELEAVSAYVFGFAPKRPTTLAPWIEAAGMRPVRPGQEAPNFEMTEVGGTKRMLSAYRGKVVLITFWAPSCAPCLAKMPDLERLAQAHRAKGLEVLPICVGEPDARAVAGAVRGRLDQLAPLIDGGMGAVQYDVQSTPTTLLIDRDGRLLARAEGEIDWWSSEVESLIEAAILPTR